MGMCVQFVHVFVVFPCLKQISLRQGRHWQRFEKEVEQEDADKFDTLLVLLVIITYILYVMHRFTIQCLRNAIAIPELFYILQGKNGAAQCSCVRQLIQMLLVRKKILTITMKTTQHSAVVLSTMSYSTNTVACYLQWVRSALRQIHSFFTLSFSGASYSYAES